MTHTMTLNETKSLAAINWVDQHKNTQSFHQKMKQLPDESIDNIIPKSISHEHSNAEISPYAQGMQLILMSPAHPERKSIERFIQTGYKQHFNANLMTFFPVILVIKELETSRILGAVGLRYAKQQQLFSENYLNGKIENLLAEHENIEVLRQHIIELGHFVVAQSTDVNVVIPMVGQFLKKLDVKWAVYTLSRPIKVAFQRLGIKLLHLQHAHPDALTHSQTDWGRYYDYKPAVYYSNILTNMNS